MYNTFYNLRGNLVFFYSPTELLEKSDINSQKVRLGGMVKKESIFKEMVLEDNFKIQKLLLLLLILKMRFRLTTKEFYPIF